MAVSATAAIGDQRPGLAFSCTAAPQVDVALATDICADLVDALQSQPDLAGFARQDPPLTNGPGLEIEITRATDTRLEVIPTWIDHDGQRSTLPTAGLATMDTTLSKKKRQDFLLKLFADLPK
jgi:hypothetical protein